MKEGDWDKADKTVLIPKFLNLSCLYDGGGFWGGGVGEGCRIYPIFCMSICKGIDGSYLIRKT